MTDLVALKSSVNLYDLASQNTQLKKVSNARGGEWAGPCPKCGGDNRFHVQATMFMCRHCHVKWGDPIEYVQWIKGVDFRGAVELLGGKLEPGARLQTSQTSQTSQITPPPARPAYTVQEVPGATWQARASEFLAYAEKQLFINGDAMAYLRGRGLSDDTILKARLGYNPKETPPDKGAKWGLDKDVIIPAGWVIPCYLASGELAYVKVRRPEGANPKYGKYMMVPGSHMALYGGDKIGGHADMVLCEGEFDCVLLRQHVGAVCDVATLASAQKNPSEQDIRLFVQIRRIWAAYDTDQAGKEGAEKVKALSARVKALTWPVAPDRAIKDITDLWRAGVTLAEWVIGQIGPGEPGARALWVRSYLDALDQAAFDAGPNESDPALVCWLALYAAYGALNWGEPSEGQARF